MSSSAPGLGTSLTARPAPPITRCSLLDLLLDLRSLPGLGLHHLNPSVSLELLGQLVPQLLVFIFPSPAGTVGLHLLQE